MSKELCEWKDEKARVQNGFSLSITTATTHSNPELMLQKTIAAESHHVFILTMYGVSRVTVVWLWISSEDEGHTRKWRERRFLNKTNEQWNCCCSLLPLWGQAMVLESSSMEGFRGFILHIQREDEGGFIWKETSQMWIKDQANRRGRR